MRDRTWAAAAMPPAARKRATANACALAFVIIGKHIRELPTQPHALGDRAILGIVMRRVGHVETADSASYRRQLVVKARRANRLGELVTERVGRHDPIVAKILVETREITLHFVDELLRRP